MKVELIACSRPLSGQCGTVKNPMDITPNPMRIIEQAASVCWILPPLRLPKPVPKPGI